MTMKVEVNESFRIVASAASIANVLRENVFSIIIQRLVVQNILVQPITYINTKEK